MSTLATNLVELTIDGNAVRVPAGTSVFDAARVNGIAIPTLCHLQSQTPVGVCRLCVVDTGARVLSAACVRPVEPGMKVSTNSPKVMAARKTLLELLMADHPSPCARQAHSGDCELETLAKQVELARRDFSAGPLRVGWTILRWPSPSITTRAFCATAAFAAATKSKTILFWGAWGRAIPPASRLT
jgi:predicted molibdopterin-dependent oxidoreductase YjgC